MISIFSLLSTTVSFCYKEGYGKLRDWNWDFRNIGDTLQHAAVTLEQLFARFVEICDFDFVADGLGFIAERHTHRYAPDLGGRYLQSLSADLLGWLQRGWRLRSIQDKLRGSERR